jgi:hypothetical protein
MHIHEIITKSLQFTSTMHAKCLYVKRNNGTNNAALQMLLQQQVDNFAIAHISNSRPGNVEQCTTSHPPGKNILDIVGLNESGYGCSCEEHSTCGVVMVTLDTVLCLPVISKYINTPGPASNANYHPVTTCMSSSSSATGEQGHEETAIAAFWFTDGIDHCRIGFLQQHHIRRHAEFNGQLVQVKDLLWI